MTRRAVNPPDPRGRRQAGGTPGRHTSRPAPHSRASLRTQRRPLEGVRGATPPAGSWAENAELGKLGGHNKVEVPDSSTGPRRRRQPSRPTSNDRPALTADPARTLTGLGHRTAPVMPTNTGRLIHRWADTWRWVCCGDDEPLTARRAEQRQSQSRGPEPGQHTRRGLHTQAGRGGARSLARESQPSGKPAPVPASSNAAEARRTSQSAGGHHTVMSSLTGRGAEIAGQGHVAEADPPGRAGGAGTVSTRRSLLLL